MMTSSCVRYPRLAVLVAVLSLGGSSVALSRAADGEIRGSIRDTSGKLVSIAVVTVQNEQTGWSKESTANAGGQFVFRPLPPGTYRVQILSPGLQKYAKPGVVVGEGETVAVTATLEPAPVEGAQEASDGGHAILGYGWNYYGYGSWSHTFAVVVTPLGRVVGQAKVSLFEPPAADFPGLSLKYTSEVDCVEIDSATGSAWLGGHIVETSNPDFFPLGLYVVDFARDGGPGNAGDAHGDTVPAWFGQPESCHGRPGPYIADPVERGNIVVR